MALYSPKYARVLQYSHPRTYGRTRRADIRAGGRFHWKGSLFPEKKGVSRAVGSVVPSKGWSRRRAEISIKIVCSQVWAAESVR